MARSNRPHADEAVDGLELLGMDRLKLLAGFCTALMVLYSFFGNIYKVPLQLDQTMHQLEKMEATQKEANAELKKTIEANTASISGNSLKINTLQVELKHMQEVDVEVKRQLDDVKPKQP